MSRILVCLDCPNYEKGGYCRHKRKDTGALTPACDYAKQLNQKFNPEDNEETMGNLAPQAKTKTCTKCGRELPISEFYARTGAKDGLQTVCKDCHNAMSKESVARRKAQDAPAPEAPLSSKKCPRCGRELPASAFGRHIRTRDGLQPYCKECRSEARIGKTSRPGKETATKYAKPKDTIENPTKAVAGITNGLKAVEDLTLVAELRARGWEVKCTRTVIQEL